MCLTWLTVRKKGQNVQVWGNFQSFSRIALTVTRVQTQEFRPEQKHPFNGRLLNFQSLGSLWTRNSQLHSDLVFVSRQHFLLHYRDA